MKLQRLQLRIDKDLKRWFKDYARGKGGMSKIVQEHIEELQNQEAKNDNGVEERARA